MLFSVKIINYSISDMEQIEMQHTKNTICTLTGGAQLFLTAFFLKVEYANNRTIGMQVLAKMNQTSNHASSHTTALAELFIGCAFSKYDSTAGRWAILTCISDVTSIKRRRISTLQLNAEYLKSKHHKP